MLKRWRDKEKDRQKEKERWKYDEMYRGRDGEIKGGEIE